MMADDKKKKVAMIIGKLGGSPEPKESNESGDEVDSSMPKEAAAEEFLAAIESKSPKALAEAFESLMELCSPSDYSESPES